MKQTNAHLIDSLLYCSLFMYLFIFGAINKEQYNKLSITCAFVCFIIHIWWMQGTTFKYIRKLTCTGIHTWRRHKISFCMCRHSIFAIIRESSR